jgi:pimeloyl-ACP methyl ester carboxylesterase
MKRFVIFVLLVFGCNCAWGSDESIPYGSNEKAGSYAKINDITLYYEVYGNGHPLLLLHGNQQSIASFSMLIPELANHFKVIAVDSRAQGKSTDSSKDISYSLMATDMSSLMKLLNITNTYVLGWSDGGIIGLELAHKFPDQIAKLVTINPNFRPGAELINLEEQLSEPYDENALSENMRRILEIIRGHGAEQEQTEYAKEVQRKLYSLINDYPNFSISQLATIETPTMVMVGDYDIIPHEHTLELFTALPFSHLAIVPGASHLFPAEKPALTLQLVVDFLKTDYYNVDPYYFVRPETPAKE